MEFLLLELLNRLDSVEEIHPEVSDSDVREAMGNAVFFGFIKPDADFVLPDVYAMYTADGNRRVKEALVPYLDAAPSIALTLGRTRHSRRPRSCRYSFGGFDAGSALGCRFDAGGESARQARRRRLVLLVFVIHAPWMLWGSV